MDRKLSPIQQIRMRARGERLAARLGEESLEAAIRPTEAPALVNASNVISNTKGVGRAMPFSVKRLTANIPFSLPVVLTGFGGSHLDGYTLLNSLLPDGVSYTIQSGIVGNNKGGLKFIFSWTDEADVVQEDIVEVSLKSASIGEFQSNLISNSFTANMMRVAVNQAIDTDQFNENVTFGKKKMFDGLNKETVQPKTQEEGMYFKDTFIDLKLSDVPVDRTNGIVVDIKNKANFTALYTLYASSFQES